MKPGFTLLEVLVSFAILSGLLALLLQSQGEAIFFMQRTAQLEQVQQEAQVRLLEVERLGKLPEPAEGTFPEGHYLAGGRWALELGTEEFMGFELSRIRILIEYPDRGKTALYQTQIWGDL
ncbi:MAG: prepilin-type N-terminal cleavage/methylation domain-containing protein [bacterium]|nr:prepilin-type N-terminal cleavage/methylation domain-containing protein [bacterium]